MTSSKKSDVQPFAQLVVVALLVVFGCRKGKGNSSNLVATANETVNLDAAIQDTVLRHIKLHSNHHFCSFETPAEVKFISDGIVAGSVSDSDFHMISWYSIYNDTIDLVAHVGEMETQALLIRFLHRKPSVYYLRAPHLTQRYFRLRMTDPFSDHVEVPPVSYHLNISAIPDPIRKPKVFGSIDMESGIYFDRRDSLKGKKVKMKFYFCSQFRSFDNLQ